MRRAAEQLRNLMSHAGSRWVVLKGGHLPGSDAIDVVTDGDRMIELAGKRIDTKNTHGTGCTLSAAIAALLPVAPDAPTAIRRAKDYLVAALAAPGALDVGKGHGPVHHFHALWKRVTLERRSARVRAAGSIAATRLRSRRFRVHRVEQRGAARVGTAPPRRDQRARARDDERLHAVGSTARVALELVGVARRLVEVARVERRVDRVLPVPEMVVRDRCRRQQRLAAREELAALVRRSGRCVPARASTIAPASPAPTS